ncbi:MAG: hypothetical protein CSB48_01535 [Proteobacteria bacterium]|nr:MAG: hypothetical protein CSB48_01535 [Pseudomonadota bacterium]
MHQFDDFAFLDPDALQFGSARKAGRKALDLASIFASDYHIETSDTISYQATVLDAFGMPAYQSGHLLLTLSVNNHAHLLALSEEKISGFLPVSTAEPGFYQELNPSAESGFQAKDVVDLIRQTCDLWKLQSRLQLAITNRQYRFLNKKGKTLVIVNIDRCQWPTVNGSAEEVAFVSVAPLVGFDSHADKVRKALAGHPAAIEKSFFDKVNIQFDALLAQESLTDCTIRPELPALSAIKMLLAQSTQGMILHTRGIIEDIDTEFLHQYRVNLRKCRSLMKEFKKLVPEAILLEFNGFFKTLGKLTANVRDLDVYELMLEDWLRQANDADRKSLMPFVNFIHKRREEALADLLDYIKNPEYGRLIAAWQLFLAETEVASENQPTLTIDKVAAKRIKKCFDKLLRDGNELHADSPDEEFHTLRLDFKRLRYLLEYFTDIFASKDYLKLIKMIKKLQTILGDFQDITVQKEKMHHFAEELAKDKKVGYDTFMLLGQMSEKISGSHDDLKNRFIELFPALEAPEVMQVTNTLSEIKVGR